MKKNIIILFAFLIFGFAYSQVGINTENPKTSLDIRGKTDGAGNLINTDIAGVQAPRLTREQLTNKGNSLYGADQKSALIYITDVSGGDYTGQRINVTQPGYYYFDGLIWRNLITLTGTVVFTASLGNGLGTTLQATLPTSNFSTIPLPNVSKNIGGGIWDPSEYTYEIPYSGTYLIKSSIRLMDNQNPDGSFSNNSPSRNILQAVDKSNADTPEGIWQTNPDIVTYPPATFGQAGLRFTMLYTRVAYFNQGDKLRLFIFSDGKEAKLSGASLNIVSLTTN